MIKTLILSRKIHRIFVLFTSVLVVIMTITGLILENSAKFYNSSFVDLEVARYLHNKLSPFLAFVLFVMTITGLVLYFGPKLISRNKPA